VLLDCGPGTLERLWRRGVLREVDAVVVSHMHADHVLDLLLFAGEFVCSLLGGRRPALYVPRGHGPAVLRRLGAAFAREESEPTRFDGAFDVREYDAEDRIAIGRLSFSFATTAHAQPCFATRVTDGRTVIVYGADGAPSAEVLALAAGADLLVLEATFADDESAARAQGHMTAAQAGELATRAGASRLLLTHQLPETLAEEIIDNAATSFAGPVELASEGYAYER
jgi:ribonuclease BN (tRNA processing enzyme)